MPQRTKTPLVLVLLISTLIILYHRTFTWLISEWLTNPYYSHGFLIPPISAFIAWLRRKEIVGVKVEEERVKSNGASLILGFGLLLLISGSLYAIFSNYSQSVLLPLSSTHSDCTSADRERN